MKLYTVAQGIKSNTAKGKRFQEAVKDILLEKYGEEIAFFKEEYKMKNVRIKMDFYVLLKSGKHIFIEAKYRNGKRGKGLCKEEATHSAINAAMMTAIYCVTNKIQDYSYEIYTNGAPKPDTATYKWLEAQMYVYKTIHEIVLVHNTEDNVEQSKRKNKNAIEKMLYG